MSNLSGELNCNYIISNNPDDRQNQPEGRIWREPSFYYFAYGSCMCPVDLKRSLGENTHAYVMGPAILKEYQLKFYGYSPKRECGVLDVINDKTSIVTGVLYQLPSRLSYNLDQREGVEEGLYSREIVDICCNNQIYKNVRTYVVVNKLQQEIAPNDWYFNVVLRGAITCGLPEEYCWDLFNKMHQLQNSHQKQFRYSLNI
ncbi:MAG: gamma-glutamylcyclotransferase [Sphaerospermopsis sp. SIO1G2]|nr:gamma-glutamylcyclotransferase [Sphaerospermopsis sp. SIO1G2]